MVSSSLLLEAAATDSFGRPLYKALSPVFAVCRRFPIVSNFFCCVKILSQKPKEVDGGERVEMLDARQAPYMNARMHARARRSVKKFSFTGMSDLFDRVCFSFS
jgi:hypothetical protein